MVSTPIIEHKESICVYQFTKYLSNVKRQQLVFLQNQIIFYLIEKIKTNLILLT